MPLIRAKDPFIFKTQFSLVETTGLKACDLPEFFRHLREVPDSAIYYHTHHFLQQHQHLTPEPPNDIAYWVTEVLQEDAVGERLAALDTVRFNSLSALREAILSVLEDHLKGCESSRKAPRNEEFYFMKCTLFSLPTPYKAYDLKEFCECLKKVSIHCLYNHVFEGRLRPPVGVNDFSNWLKNNLSETALADKIEKLDPYTQTMEGLRQRIIRMAELQLAKGGYA